MNDYIPTIFRDDFDYTLPKERIALYPLTDRDKSKLLTADVLNDKITHNSFSDLPDLIPSDSIIIFNNSKVISARILMKKASGGSAELLLTESIEPSADPQLTMKSVNSCKWNCIVGGRRIREGTFLLANKNQIQLRSDILIKNSNEAIVNFTWENDLAFAEILSIFGNVPLPPYIDRNPESEDSSRYQTVYAGWDGSVAAPTAGLHFTENLINKLSSKGILKSNITLHVGPGTFLPVATDELKDHNMHEERFFLTKNELEIICRAALEKRKFILTGTTSLRTMETLYWIGVMISIGEIVKPDTGLTFDQWDAYRLESQNAVLPDRYESFVSLLKFVEKNDLSVLSLKTKLLIVPSYKFKTADGIITNFHIPKSTLLMLIAAFTGGNRWEEIYDEALKNNYRFLSYGDSSFLYKY